MVIVMSAAGAVTVVTHAERGRPFLEALGVVGEVRRGGYVLPAHPVRRWCFRVVRWAGRWFPVVAAWTRRWRGPWIADLSCSGGPVLGPFVTRSEAIRAEEAWLVGQLLLAG